MESSSFSFCSDSRKMTLNAERELEIRNGRDSLMDGGGHLSGADSDSLCQPSDSDMAQLLSFPPPVILLFF
ncbi:hypothetical protein DPX16_13782 [Anabarilius grahami]|uniref:Uncharacterized protein n=1 Tax=Anabarilius grahami TaxID=495550 RepID=A0A3N0XRZ5_ANAGA|nr:hypothetical protein DPX16_13782 [Anabarilius grahami]